MISIFSGAETATQSRRLPTRSGHFESYSPQRMSSASYMFRDTFAVELFKRGVALETVSMLLGHASIKSRKALPTVG